MTDDLCVLVIGAHPDDADLKAGGVAAKYAAGGHDVHFVSATNGDRGHHEIDGPELARRRRREARAAADVIGIDYRAMEVRDGELEPTLENRKRIVRLIRTLEPDLVLTHRPNDYHPDHRYASILVRDAAYMVTVPSFCPETPALREDPVIAYLSDEFRRPYPFDPDVVVSIDDVVDDKMAMLHEHTSQMYEWLPYADGKLAEVPESDAERLAWLEEERLPEFRDVADRYRDELVDRYGKDAGADVEYAEAFEGCEYGTELTDENAERLFPC